MTWISACCAVCCRLRQGWQHAATLVSGISMNIVMLSNTYAPHVGGVARSIERFARQYRKLGHKVLIVAPEFDHDSSGEQDVVRIPAVQNFNGSDFSVALPVSGLLSEALEEFQPQIVHAHHPFLLGMTALRIARYRQLPLVFTHHTLYAQYTHYVPGDSPLLQRFAVQLVTRYANLADMVFAPSESIAVLLRERGVQTPISVVPTGVELSQFSQGDGLRYRRKMGIPETAFVVGHVGRLAPEKNLEFLAASVAGFIAAGLTGAYEGHGRPQVHCLVIGAGPSEADIRAVFARTGITARLHLDGVQNTQVLADAYHAMDVFAFASTSETQGMVLTEAMAAGKPVVALDASGVREVVVDTVNGRLLADKNCEDFAAALRWVAEQPTEGTLALQRAALETAARFSMTETAGRALDLYELVLQQKASSYKPDDDAWLRLLELIKAEWSIIEGFAEAAGSSLLDAR
jgi:1,2-diacylglycerol 3-alpha-glucosyltransferase